MRANSLVVWTGAAFAAAGLLAASTLALFGASAHGTILALQFTGRFSFLLFLPAYAGSAAVTLLGSRFDALRPNGRIFGLCYAAAQIVHLGLVAWLCWIGAAPAIGVFLLFGSAAACTGLLALLSIRALQQALGRTLWRYARILAMNVIAYAFAADFVAAPVSATPKYLLFYLPFAILSLAGPACILLAPLARLLRAARAHTPWRRQPPRPA